MILVFKESTDKKTEIEFCMSEVVSHTIVSKHVAANAESKENVSCFSADTSQNA